MEEELFILFQKLISQQKIISLVGESSTGKTTLALQLITNLMMRDQSKNEQAIWIQSSESFPKKRAETMYRDKPDVALDVLGRIFVIPKEKPFSNITAQSEFFKSFNNLILPPGVKYIVIDNISHHLRHAQANILEVREKMNHMNGFFTQQLYPLIMFCLRNKYYLFLIHEVSFDPQSGRLRAYNGQLFERIRGLEISLSNSIDNKRKTMKLFAEKTAQQYSYRITDRGLIIV
ncbi:MAG: hypothetical protein EU517_01650 [Promethearchaeota archaeon]|nr:MAG: hypothetical protein EU517_01650 [Candidatus Lokiarchaeota archaeon]